LIVQIATIFAGVWIWVVCYSSRKVPPRPISGSEFATRAETPAYREGLFARALGKPGRANPYPRSSHDSFYWREGWHMIGECESDKEQVGLQQWLDDATREAN
jgi:hypothetical protein